MIEPAPDVIHLSETDSTNAHARRLIESDAPALRPLVVSADVQTAGRGRLGRAWASPFGGVWMTIALPDAAQRPLDAQPHAALPLIVALAAHDVVASLCRDYGRDELVPRLEIKWPNDLLLDGAKLAGVLCERLTHAGNAWTIIGVGLNADIDPEDLAITDRPVTTLRAALRAPMRDLWQLREQLAAGVLARAARLRIDGFTATDARDLSRRLAYRGRAVRVGPHDQPEAGRLGRVLGVAPGGGLLLDTPEGAITAVSGELSLFVGDTQPASSSQD